MEHDQANAKRKRWTTKYNGNVSIVWIWSEENIWTVGLYSSFSFSRSLSVSFSVCLAFASFFPRITSGIFFNDQCSSSLSFLRSNDTPSPLSQLNRKDMIRSFFPPPPLLIIPKEHIFENGKSIYFHLILIDNLKSSLTLNSDARIRTKLLSIKSVLCP